MPRSLWTDILQSHLFWAFDATGFRGVPVFTPLFGFSAISAPKINVEVETFKDGTFIFPRHAVKGASVGPLIFQRAATLYDSDFYQWIILAIHGQVGKYTDLRPVRRNLVVVQFTRFNVGDLGGVAAGAMLGTLAGALSGSLGGNASFLAGAVGGGVAGGVSVAAGAPVGPFAFAARVPARAWLLHNCIPVSYVAGSEFSADSPAPSIMQLEVQPEYVEEFSMGIQRLL